MTNGENGFSPSGNGHLSQTGRTYSTKITTETTASAAEEGTEGGNAVAALVQELVSKGVSRAVAERYAREKPAVCRQCLAYLPFAKPRTTPGTWLANAIRDEYGPPDGYVKAKQQAEHRRTTSHETMLQNHQERRRQEKLARLACAYQAMEKTQGDALMRFNRYVEEEKRKVARIARVLSGSRRDEMVVAFDHSERRLELFERWMDSHGQ